MSNKPTHTKVIKREEAEALGCQLSEWEKKNKSKYVQVVSAWEKFGDYGDYTEISIDIAYLEDLLESTKKSDYKTVKLFLSKNDNNDKGFLNKKTKSIQDQGEIIDPDDLPF